MSFEIVVTMCAIVSSAVASITGFGIGSIMTPLLSLEVELKAAVAIVSIPHFVATTERFWRLRKNVDRSVILNSERLPGLEDLAPMPLGCHSHETPSNCLGAGQQGTR